MYGQMLAIAHVVEAMRQKGYNVGGEASGHIVLSDFGTTGDGLVAALQILACMQLIRFIALAAVLLRHLGVMLAMRMAKGKRLVSRLKLFNLMALRMRTAILM